MQIEKLDEAIVETDKPAKDVVLAIIQNQNKIIDWINKYEGAKEEFRQKLLSGKLAGLQLDEKQQEIVNNAKLQDGEFAVANNSLSDELRSQTLANPDE